MEQWRLWNRNLPNVKPYYAVKCNPDPTLLGWLYRRNAAFDCASAREMSLVQEHFGKQSMGNHVLFANPCKTHNDIVVGKSLGVPWVTADSTEELEKMAKAQYKPEVLLRVAVDDSGSSSPFAAKFGLEPNAVEEVVRAASSLQIPVVGLSFHVGSGSKSPTAFGSAVHLVLDQWKALHDKRLVPYSMKALDLGGGWSSNATLFKEQAASAYRAARLGPIPQQLIAEPGRFFAAPTHDLYVQVVGKKPRAGGGWRYTLDESIYGQFSCIPFDHALPRMARIRLNNHGSRPKTPATLFGRTCDSLDWIANSDGLEELDVGDWLYIPDMGAYTTATSTEFNGFPKPDVVLTDERPEESNLSWLTSLSYPLAKMLSVEEAVKAVKQ
jgi:ornithine decarboxylase